MFVFIWLFYIFANVLCCDQTSNQTVIKIFSITSLSNTYNYIIPAWKIAINEINNNPYILENYCIELIELEDCQNNKLKSLQQALEITKRASQTSSKNVIISPIILGSPYSAFSILTAKVFESYNMAQISSTAASTTLTDVASFYRVIPSNELQGKMYIPLIKKFKWSKINIIYVNDEYGTNLKNEIIKDVKMEKDFPIQVFSKSYISGDNQTIQDAARDIATNKHYINILVTLSADTHIILSKFKKYGVLEFPYYYLLRLALDFDHKELTKLIPGEIALMPAYPATMTPIEYNGDETVYKKSRIIDSHFVSEWNDLYHINKSIVYNYYNNSKPHTYSRYGYDGMYALSYGLDFIAKQYGLNNLNDLEYRSIIMKGLKQFFANNLTFIGATGIVDFDENGNRMHGRWLLVNIDTNGVEKHLGGIIHDGHNISIPRRFNVTWPPDFNDETYPYPVSYNQTEIEYANAGHGWFLGVSILMIISICMAMVFCIATVRFSEQMVNLLCICIGCILCYIGVFWGKLMYYDINIIGDYLNDYICIIPVYSMGIAFTLIFGPMIIKMYQIYNDVKDAKKNEKSNQNELTKPGYSGLICMLLMLLIDVIIFVIVVSYHYDSMTLSKLELVSIDKLVHNEIRITQYQYKHCVSSKTATILFDIFVGYKILQFVALLFCSGILFLKHQTNYYRLHRYFILWLISIIITAIIFVVIIGTVSFGNGVVNHENMWTYSGLIQVLIIINMNVVLFFYVAPILYAARNNKETIIYVSTGNDDEDEEDSVDTEQLTFSGSHLNSLENGEECTIIN